MNALFELPAIADLHDAALTQRLQTAIDQKTKPLGALGQLETLALRLGQILGTEAPRLDAPQMVVFAGDHGLAAKGVSAYPSDVTWQMVQNFLAGGAAVSVLARQHGLALSVVDCGVAHDFAPQPAVAGQPQLILKKVAPGTADASAGPAMTSDQCAAAGRDGDWQHLGRLAAVGAPVRRAAGAGHGRRYGAGRGGRGTQARGAGAGPGRQRPGHGTAGRAGGLGRF